MLCISSRKRSSLRWLTRRTETPSQRWRPDQELRPQQITHRNTQRSHSSLISESEQPASLPPRPHWIAFPDRRLQHGGRRAGCGTVAERCRANRWNGSAGRSLWWSARRGRQRAADSTSGYGSSNRTADRSDRPRRCGGRLPNARTTLRMLHFTCWSDGLEWLIDDILESDGFVCAQLDSTCSVLQTSRDRACGI